MRSPSEVVCKSVTDDMISRQITGRKKVICLLYISSDKLRIIIVVILVVAAVWQRIKKALATTYKSENENC
jgi:hypothetical protein